MCLFHQRGVIVSQLRPLTQSAGPRFTHTSWLRIQLESWNNRLCSESHPGTAAITTSRTVTKRYHKPGRFAVVAVASAGRTSVTSEAFPLVVQRAVRLNRLVHPASVLQNGTATVSCRVNAGTDLSFRWSFGDGSSRLGQSAERHVFHRTGEFRVEVTVSNLVSSASLSSHIFVVDRPCQPPPVKNMGPLKLQVRRYEVIRLGVTYETEIDCDAPGGLQYTWTVLDSAGRILSLPLTDTHTQGLTLQSHLLQYDTYTATARVQVVGSVVYSNYSVRVQVMPSPPVAFIQGGTNVFINNGNATVLTLDGQRSHDPDFPMNPLSYSWTCKPLSSIATTCFNRHISTSSPVLTFPVRLLKHDFDQFQFTLTVHSGERSASSDTFLTVVPNLLGKLSVDCPHCQGDQVNWDQSFSVGASCEDCGVSHTHLRHTWSLYLVNASSRPVTEVPFCHTVDLGAPSTITVDQTPGTSALHPPHTDTPHDARAVHSSAPALLTEIAPETTGTRKQNVGPTDSLTSAKKSRNFNIIGDFPTHSGSSAEWESSFPGLESGDMGGRQGCVIDSCVLSGVDGETLSPGADSVFDPAEGEGSNLVVSRPSVLTQEPTLLDLPRDSVDRDVFESYTYTGISSPSVSLRPFSLRPGSRYMLEVTAQSRNSLVGRTQLFLKTKPVPRGMTCQVQPVKGMELHTHFSIFCTSGKEDLLYEYSFSVGGRRPRVLYRGRDFQYYFSLPSGDPSDDYKVTIYTEVRSGTHGTATKPCPVTVKVEPSFLRDTSPHHDPDLELSGAGLRSLSALVGLGNSQEIRNHVRLLSGILNRLSLEAEANAQAQRHVRSVLIGTVCELEGGELVTLASARRATVHVQSVSDLFWESSAPGPYHLDQEILDALVVLLSHILRAAVAHRDLGPESPNASSIAQVLEWDPPTGDNTRRTSASPSGRTPASPDGEHITQGRSTSAQQATRLVVDALQTASDLMLVSDNKRSLLVLHASYHHRTSTVVRGGSATFYAPAPLIQLLFVHRGGAAGSREERPCVLSVLTELARDPHTPGDVRLGGPVVDLSLFRCSGRRRVPVRSLLQPIDVELQRPPGNKSSVREYVLLRSRVSYHSLNITQDHLQQAVQLSVAFRPLPGKVFPIMLLFRMFERPTPSMHHLRRVHHWESNSTRITLPPAYFNTAGVGHLALLNADFGKASGHKHMSDRISYSLTVVSSQCLSWDDQQGAWTHEGCRTQQTDTTTAVNCSCVQLRPLTVVQQQIQSSHGTADLDPFLSVSHDLTVVLVLVLCVCLYVPGLAACKRADVISEENGRVHYLPDNSPVDPHLYAVTIHTGLCSAASMSAKVYIVLYGEDGFSHTRELQVPGCTLFRRNARDTFILSAADSLGPVWGVHIWHDGSGLSPDWYLKHVEVSEVNRGHVKGRAWLLVTQCWVAVNKGDGQVERMLRVCSHGLGFAEMLRFKLSDLLADFHIWMSVYSCPCPNLFTRTQRLSVCLLLLLGYACVNTVIISQMDDQLPFELGVLDVSAVSVTTGVLSVVAVLPGATMISFLFRLHEVKLTRSGAQHGTDLLSVSTSILESKDTDKEPMNQPDVIVRKGDGLTVESRTGPVLRNLLLISKGEDADHVSQIKEIERSMFCGTQKDPVSSMRDEDKVKARRVGPTYQRCHYLAWALCLLLSLSCLALSGVLGMRFSSSKVLLWTHSLFFSLICCIFFIQPVVILIVAVTVSFWYRKRADFHTFSRIEELQIQLCSRNSLLATRQRARYLRLVRPPTVAELRRTRWRKRRETLIHNTLRDLSVCVSMVGLMLCVTYGSPFGDHYHLNKAVRKQFLRIDYENDFMSVQRHEDWWKWTRSSLLNLLYKNASQSHILIGEPILRTSTYPHSIVTVPTATPPSTCGRLGCYSGPSTTVGLGHTKSDAASKLNLLHSGGWFGRRTVALKVQFTLFSPAPNLFTSVTLLAEQSPTNVLLPSSKVQSARVYRTTAVWDYVVMVCQLIFLFMSLLQLCIQVCTARQQGLMGYWRTPCNWLEVALLTVSLVYYVYHIHHSIIIMDAVEQLHRHRGHVEVSTLASWEQDIRTLSGVTLLLLATKCVTLLRVNRTVGFSATLLTRSLSSLMWPTVSGLILLVGLSCAGSLLFAQSSGAFSSILRSLQTLLSHHWGLRRARSLLLSGRDFLYGGTLYLSSSVLIAVVSSSVRGAKRSQSRRDVFTAAELFCDHISKKNPVNSFFFFQMYYLEEFESLVDELLFRLTALSNGLHHTLPPKLHHYLEEHSPVTSPIQEPSNTDTKVSHARVKRGEQTHACSALAHIHAPCMSSSIRIWTQDVLEKRADQWTGTTQATHTEVVVEVLVHEEPGSAGGS
uniref:Polycystic kidney disease protein 1-like 1 n=1 Tax=Scophthalmus maximus TaxID=52904 RepID=A0A8D3B804_SCOMX